MALTQISRRQLDLGLLEYFEPVAEDPAGNQLKVLDGWLKNEDSMLYVAEQFTTAFPSVAAPNLVRWDLVYMDLSGNLTIVPGLENLAPVAEFTGAQDPPAYCYPLAYVYINEAGTVVVDVSDITDIRPPLNFLYDSDYASNYVISDGDKPNEAIDKIDLETDNHQDYTGKKTLGTGAVLPSYSTLGSPQYGITNNQDLTQALANLDTEANRVKLFSGKDNIGQAAPIYSTKGSPERAITDGDPLAEAVAKIDNSLLISVSNIGGASEIFKQLANGDIELRTLEGISGITISPSGDKLQISGAGIAGLTKAAWGKTPAFSSGGDSTRTVTVDLTNGTTTHGTYEGDAGMTYASGVYFSVAFIGTDGGPNTWPQQYSNAVVISTSPYRFQISEQQVATHTHRGSHWLAVGK